LLIFKIGGNIAKEYKARHGSNEKYESQWTTVEETDLNIYQVILCFPKE